MKVLKYLRNRQKGDSDLFAEMYRGKLVYDHSESQWYNFNGSIWEADDHGKIIHRLEKVAATYETAINKAKDLDDGTRRYYRSRVNALRDFGKAHQVLKFAATKLPLTQEWDSNPYLLAVKNGVLDLKTGKLRDGEPEDYIRKCSEVEWKGIEEKAPRFELFLSEIFDNNVEVIEFIKRMFGYAITGLCAEHVFPVFYGAEGRNGKDTLLKLICKILGKSFASPVSKEVLLSGMKNPGASAPFLFELQGKRLVYADETSEGSSFDEGQIKMISGGAPFQAKKLYNQPTTIEPQYLIIMTTNDKPNIRSDDPAIWERIILIEFNQRFIEHPEFPNEHKVDKFLDDKLQAEMSGVLAWLVQGCLEWQEHKSFLIPDSVRYSTDTYRDEADIIGKFIKEMLVIEEGTKCYSVRIRQLYEQWITEEGSKLNKRNFARKMKSKFTRKRDGKGYYYEGVHCKAENDSEVEALLKLAKKKD